MNFFHDLGGVLLEFDWTREISLGLLKGIYQNIVPRDIRRKFAEIILSKVVGIDLNPVTVITAKANYLLQIYVLLTRWLARGVHFEVPPYLSSSLK